MLPSDPHMVPTWVTGGNGQKRNVQTDTRRQGRGFIREGIRGVAAAPGDATPRASKLIPEGRLTED
jgi:hypothetical protein